MNKKQLLEISKSFDCYVKMYDSKKYPEDIYKKARIVFSSKKSNNREIANALNWKYGNIGKEDYPGAHKSIIKEVENSWKHFVNSNATSSPKDTFVWWKDRLSKGKSSRFVTIAFITHLIHLEKDVPIIDQHNYRAMSYFKNNSVLSPDAKKNPSNWDDIECLKGFISDISKSLNKKNDEVDKYLMMFGKELKKK